MSSEEKNDLQLDIDNMLERLLANPDKPIQMSEEEINILCEKSKAIFLQQPMLLELKAPIKICGKVISSFFKRRCSDTDLRKIMSENICFYVFFHLTSEKRIQLVHFSPCIFARQYLRSIQ